MLLLQVRSCVFSCTALLLLLIGGIDYFVATETLKKANWF